MTAFANIRVARAGPMGTEIAPDFAAAARHDGEGERR